MSGRKISKNVPPGKLWIINNLQFGERRDKKCKDHFACYFVEQKYGNEREIRIY